MNFFKIIGKWVRYLLAFVNVLAALVMCVAGYAHLISPAKYANTELLALAFPIPLIVCLAFILIWLVIHPKFSLISIVALIVCWGPVRDYCPVNLPSKAPEGCISVMSFNICNFPGAEKLTAKVDTIIDYLAESNADILCLQESARSNEDVIDERIRQIGYEYVAHHKKGKAEHISVYSKYPISWSEEIQTDSKYNICSACCVDVEGKPLLVINCHFESFSFHHWEKKAIQKMLQRKGTIDDKHKRLYLEKILSSAKKRAPQAEAVAKYIKQHSDMSIVLCGDFNDPPNSYAYHQIAKQLKNCYRANATGPGYTYSHGGMYFRIDNIFCSDDMKPYMCDIDAKTNISDHYPIACRLKMLPKP